MNNKRVKLIAGVALSLLIGFTGGFASRNAFDKQNAASANEIGASVPVHKMKAAPITTNQLIAPRCVERLSGPLLHACQFGYSSTCVAQLRECSHGCTVRQKQSMGA